MNIRVGQMTEHHLWDYKCEFCQEKAPFVFRIHPNGTGNLSFLLLAHKSCMDEQLLLPSDLFLEYLDAYKSV